MRKRNKETVPQASMQVMGELAELQLSTSGESDNAICPKCGVAYTDSEGLCIAMGGTGCSMWNAPPSKRRNYHADVYFCEECIYKLIVITFFVMTHK